MGLRKTLIICGGLAVFTFAFEAEGGGDFAVHCVSAFEEFADVEDLATFLAGCFGFHADDLFEAGLEKDKHFFCFRAVEGFHYEPALGRKELFSARDNLQIQLCDCKVVVQGHADCGRCNVRKHYVYESAVCIEDLLNGCGSGFAGYVALYEGMVR